MSLLTGPYNQALHSLSLVHGVMNPQVSSLHQRSLCPAHPDSVSLTNIF